MQRMTAARHVLLAIVVGSVAGCADEHLAQADGIAVEEQRSPAASVDSLLATRDSQSLPTYGNQDELLDSLAPHVRAKVMAFYEGYGDSIIDFHGAEQLGWLRTHQYPMPDDVLAASQNTEDQLLAEYRTGNIQAGFFYLDRAATRLASGANDISERRQLDGVAREYLASGSPLAGYAYYNYQRKVHQDSYAAFAGLMFASDLGDGRAWLEMMNQAYPVYAENPASLDPMKLLFAYRHVLSNVRARNPNLLTHSWPPFPPVKPKI